jgi:hypothetical protein
VGSAEGGERRHRAGEAVARRFTLAMNAATSRWGALCDIVPAFGAAAVLGLLVAIAAHFGATALAWLLAAAALVPLVACAAANLALRDARERVIDWIASLPFPIENVNAVLAGAGEEFEVHFTGAAPSRDEVMGRFAVVSEDLLVLAVHDEQRMVRARLGILDHKHDSFRDARLRYARLLETVGRALLPLHERSPIERVVIR